MPFVFPAHLLNPQSVKLSLTAKVVQSPPSLSGVTQTVRTDGGGLWQVQYSGIVLRTADARRIWGVWDSYLSGGAQSVKVPMLSNLDAPRGRQGGNIAKYGGLAFTGNEYFPESVKYVSSLVIATASAAPSRSTSIYISILRGLAPKGSEIFSIRYSDGTDRAHRIVRPLGGNAYVIDPPLRRAIDNNTPLEFDWPVLDCVAVVGNDISADIANGRAEVAISFQETF